MPIVVAIDDARAAGACAVQLWERTGWTSLTRPVLVSAALGWVWILIRGVRHLQQNRGWNLRRLRSALWPVQPRERLHVRRTYVRTGDDHHPGVLVSLTVMLPVIVAVWPVVATLGYRDTGDAALGAVVGLSVAVIAALVCLAVTEGRVPSLRALVRWSAVLLAPVALVSWLAADPGLLVSAVLVVASGVWGLEFLAAAVRPEGHDGRCRVTRRVTGVGASFCTLLVTWDVLTGRFPGTPPWRSTALDGAVLVAMLGIMPVLAAWLTRASAPGPVVRRTVAVAFGCVITMMFAVSVEASAVPGCAADASLVGSAVAVLALLPLVVVIHPAVRRTVDSEAGPTVLPVAGRTRRVR